MGSRVLVLAVVRHIFFSVALRMIALGLLFSQAFSNYLSVKAANNKAAVGFIKKKTTKMTWRNRKKTTMIRWRSPSAFHGPLHRRCRWNQSISKSLHSKQQKCNRWGPLRNETASNPNEPTADRSAKRKRIKINHNLEFIFARCCCTFKKGINTQRTTRDCSIVRFVFFFSFDVRLIPLLLSATFLFLALFLRLVSLFFFRRCVLLVYAFAASVGCYSCWCIFCSCSCYLTFFDFFLL